MCWLYESTDKKQFINLFNSMFVDHRRIYSFHKEEEVIAIELTPITHKANGEFVVTDKYGEEHPAEFNRLTSIPTAKFNLKELRSVYDKYFDEYFDSKEVNVGDGLAKSLIKALDELKESRQELNSKNEYIKSLLDTIKKLSDDINVLTHPGYSEQVIAAKRKEITDFVKSKFL